MKALITGITGQDGSYLTEYLLGLGYEVHGVVRRVAQEDPRHRLWRLRHLQDRIKLHSASLESYPSIFHIVKEVQPDECYHLGAQSFVATSFEDEFSTFRANIDGTHHVLSSIRHMAPKCKVYFAASSEMYGKVHQMPQTEETPFHPRSTYGISKVAGFYLTKNYREAYGLFAVSGILFNHESPRRGLEFVTRKITVAVARIKLGLEKTLKLGNLEARRDWGDAREYVRVMHLMLQQKDPDDYLIASGETHSVREFCEMAFARAGLNWQDHVQVDPAFYRPADVEVLLGDASKARHALGWEYRKPLSDLVHDMVDHDLEMARHSPDPLVPPSVE